MVCSSTPISRYCIVLYIHMLKQVMPRMNSFAFVQKPTFTADIKFSICSFVAFCSYHI